MISIQSRNRIEETIKEASSVNETKYFNNDSKYSTDTETIQYFKKEVIRKIAEQLARAPMEDGADFDNYIYTVINGLDNNSVIPKKDKVKLVQDVKKDVFGYGPLETLISDDEISEIMVNGPKQIKIEIDGKLYDTNITFDNDEHVRKVINRIVSPIGRHVDEANPMVDARLPNGSRVNIIIPPVSLSGSCITIRKFRAIPFTMKDLLEINTLSEEMALFLEQAVYGRLNIIISGGTGSGKTTFLNVLSSYIPESERIITIEDSAELKLHQNHVISLESRPANIEGSGEITIRDLVVNALRMRPDRIIVGEVRSGETIDMLQAMNTGHDGSLTTVHANSARDALARIETTALMSGLDVPAESVRQQSASAFNLIVQQTRLRDGTRKIVSIDEVCGYSDGVVTTQQLFRFVHDENLSSSNPHDMVKGHYEALGIIPKCADKMMENGAVLDNAWFTSKRFEQKYKR